MNVDGEPFGEDPNVSSYKYEPEVAFFKASTDVIMNGHAYAPRVELPRRWSRFVWAPSKSKRWSRVTASGFALVDESPRLGPSGLKGSRCNMSAPSAVGTELIRTPLAIAAEFPNPVGVSYRAGHRFEDGVRLPNLEDPRVPMRDYGDRPAPTAFGFVSPHWHPRAALAGTYDQRWQKGRAPLLPKDFDRRHLSAASPGLLTPSYLRGD